MSDNSYTRKNCLQWGLRVLPLETYYALLKRYTVNISPDGYDIIRKAQAIKKGEIWWWQWLCCEILDNGKWINIGTGKRIANRDWNKIATFPTWAAYESFREKLREATAKRLRDNPQLV